MLLNIPGDTPALASSSVTSSVSTSVSSVMTGGRVKEVVAGDGGWSCVNRSSGSVSDSRSSVSLRGPRIDREEAVKTKKCQF